MIILNLTTYNIEGSYESFQVVTEWNDSANNPDMIICDLMSDLIPFERDTWYPKVILHRPSLNQGVLKELINNNLVWAYTTTLEELHNRLLVLNAILEFEKSLDDEINVDYYHQKLSDLVSLFTHKEMLEYVRLQTEYDLIDFLSKEFDDDSIS